MTYSEGVCGDGAVILKDGVPLRVHEIISEFNELELEIETLKTQLKAVKGEALTMREFVLSRKEIRRF